MDVERKVDMVMRRPAEEVLTREDLKQMFETEAHPRHYIGFEISGKVHLGTGLSTALKIRDFMEAGIKPTIFLADYHAWINGKMGGDLEKIQRVANGYFKSAFLSLGLEEGKVDYVLASELYDNDYWKSVLEVSKSTTLARMLRCTTIMGRKEGDATDSASVLYPAMQVADIFKLDVSLAHSGMDQRKVHVLAREVAEKLKKRKPAAVHVKLLMGLQGPKRMGMDSDEKADMEISSKMSKSDPDSCIYIHDSEEDIKRKLKKAYCPEKQVSENPLIDMCEILLLRDDGTTLKIERPEKFGGDLELNLRELKSTYSEGKLHPVDLKNAVGKELSRILEPSRKYFEQHKELLGQVG
ncbi:MAG: tyrosine--tRNA ligase [Candidatus Micrarchaeota archaeon]